MKSMRITGARRDRLLTRLVACSAPFALLACALHGQDISGNWQGTLKAPAQDLRAVFQIAKDPAGAWTAKMYSIDQSPNAIPVAVHFDGSIVRMTADLVRGTYEGKLSADGTSISGNWTQGIPLPLELRRATKETAWAIDPSPHKIQFITVEKDVKLEVLDWGGSGRSLVLLTGLGDNAHVFDKFAPKLAETYHVYGVTRRGFGDSTIPAGGYDADRLGDDVLAVVDALKLDRPVVAGHSIGGEELSSIGSRHPEKVAGLIYLDAGYSYAFFDASRGDLNIQRTELQRKLELLQPGKTPPDFKAFLRELVENDLPAFEKKLRETQKTVDAMSPAEFAQFIAQPADVGPRGLIMSGVRKYTSVSAPVLAIFALPHDMGPFAPPDPAARKAAEAREEESTGAQVSAFEKGIPAARVVRLPHANHYVFRSNEADVLREMNAFIRALPERTAK
jgi:pimeloyl-ACP methyl ester carboxylesterase